MKNHTVTEVIKIGGSVLFDKKGNFNQERANYLTDVALKLEHRVILVIGCGHHLHNQVLDNNLTDKPEKNSYGLELGMSKRISSFQIIYNSIERNLIKMKAHQTDFKLVHPTNLIIKKSQGKNRHEIDWFNEKYNEGTIKNFITSGGVVYDRNILFSAISSDTIASYLAVKYQAERLILLTDTKGIYTDMESEKIINNISLCKKDLYKIFGGMKSKLRRIYFAVKSGIPTIIGSGMSASLAEEILIHNNYQNSTQVTP